MNRRGRILATARLELAELARSRLPVFSFALPAAISALLILIGMRESNVLGFTGMGRVLLSLCHVLILILPLTALLGAGTTLNRARDDGLLELMFSLPLDRGEYYVAITATRYLALTAPIVVAIGALGLLGRAVFGQPIPWEFLARTTAIAASLTWSFAAIGLAISTITFNQAKTLIYLLTTWVLAVAVVDFGMIGLMLQWRIDPRTVFILACLNPVQCARMALLSAAEPSLGVLGPVGFYLANHVGTNALFALGIAQPILIGLIAWTIGLRTFLRGDLV
jgi:ABC-2 type transport system permease protein